MRTTRWIIAMAALGLLAGCGDRHLVLKVDVLSYLDPTLTHAEFGPIPAIPGGLSTGEQQLVKDAQINLVDGTTNPADAQSISISMTTIATDSTGSGADTLRLYVSDTNTDPLTTPPVAVLPMMLEPGVTDTAHVDLGSDQRVADLFASKKLRITLTNSLRGPDDAVSSEPLNAKVAITEIEAVMVAGRKSE